MKNNLDSWKNELRRELNRELRRRGSSPVPWFLAGAATGALALYFLDPSQGRRRRAWFVEKSGRYGREAAAHSAKLARHLRNKAKGLQARAAQLAHPQDIQDDERLVHRIRSEFGRVLRHPKPVEVYATNGVVTLSGPVLRSELARLLACVHGVPGVRELVNHLDVFDSSENIPSLQGEGKTYLQ